MMKRFSVMPLVAMYLSILISCGNGKDKQLAADNTVVESIEAPTGETQEVYMSLWGSIGDASEVDFEVEGNSGWYKFEREGVNAPKRTLQLVSYNQKDGSCVLNAYLNNDYIGKFEGIFHSDEVDLGDGDSKVIQTYKGTFKSVKGVNIEFYLYAD